MKPPRDEDDPGEVEVIAALGQHLIVLEVKSTFMRRSQQEAWRHACGTLRKAGRQLQRKLAAVSQAISLDMEFRTSLGLTEEVLIALRDDRHLLNDPEGLLSGIHDPCRPVWTWRACRASPNDR